MQIDSFGGKNVMTGEQKRRFIAREYRKNEVSAVKRPVIIYRLGRGAGGFWAGSLDF